MGTAVVLLLLGVVLRFADDSCSSFLEADCEVGEGFFLLLLAADVDLLPLFLVVFLVTFLVVFLVVFLAPGVDPLVFSLCNFSTSDSLISTSCLTNASSSW